MDNANSHKSNQVKELIESIGGKLIYLSPYSPDMNLIEHIWASLKRLIHVHPEQEENLQQAINESIWCLFMD